MFPEIVAITKLAHGVFRNNCKIPFFNSVMSHVGNYFAMSRKDEHLNFKTSMELL